MFFDLIGEHEKIVALRNAILSHPDLMEKCADAADFAECIAEVAAYCNVVLDGAYDVDEIINLCGILAARLTEKSTIIIPVGFDPKKVKDAIIHDELEYQEVAEAVDWPAELNLPSDAPVGNPDISELQESEPAAKFQSSEVSGLVSPSSASRPENET